jgi:phenylalanyl-tRNA synthetase alpha chain
MRTKLEQIRKEAKHSLANLDNLELLESFRVQYLGKKGKLTQVLRGMGSLPPEERPRIGQLANEIRAYLENKLEEKARVLKENALARRLEEETIDVTMPGKRHYRGKLHPLNIVLNEIKDVFLGLGFEIAEGPEVEWDYYNFEALNMPKNHPARDTQDTFYISDSIYSSPSSHFQPSIISCL